MKIVVAGETDHLAGKFQVISAWSRPDGICCAEFRLVRYAALDRGDDDGDEPGLVAELSLPRWPALVPLIATALWLGQRAYTRR
jgi:hypothetical protein